jgi:crotonobetainyl-CoA:carnitine CoA-transferase CaiB-like acyl-CoA transferase
LYRCEGRDPFYEPAGPWSLGEHALYRLYETEDGWVFLGATHDQLGALRSLPEFDGVAVAAAARGDDGGPCARPPAYRRAGDTAFAASLETVFRRRTTDEWIRRLGSLGVGVTSVRSYDELVDSRLSPAGCDVQRLPAPVWVRHDHHPSGYVIDQVAQSGIRMTTALVTEPHDPPRFGAQTREILGELGLSEGRIEDLLSRGVAREAWGEQYLPD